MGHARRADDLRALVPVGRRADILEQALPAAQQDGHDGDVEVVDETGAEVLLDRAGAAAEPDVGASGSLEGLLVVMVAVPRPRSSMLISPKKSPVSIVRLGLSSITTSASPSSST